MHDLLSKNVPMITDIIRDLLLHCRTITIATMEDIPQIQLALISEMVIDHHHQDLQHLPIVVRTEIEAILRLLKDQSAGTSMFRNSVLVQFQERSLILQILVRPRLNLVRGQIALLHMTDLRRELIRMSVLDTSTLEVLLLHQSRARTLHLGLHLNHSVLLIVLFSFNQECQCLHHRLHYLHQILLPMVE